MTPIRPRKNSRTNAASKKHSPARHRGALSDAAKLEIAFDQLWTDLFTSRRHLDSLLSKQEPAFKSKLAVQAGSVLLRPASLARHLRVELTNGEPWCLDAADRAEWSVARHLAQRLKESGDTSGARGGLGPDTLDNFPPEMVEECVRSWGQAAAEKLLAILSRPAPLSLRVYRSKGADEVLSALKPVLPVGVTASFSGLVPDAISISSYAPVMATETFRSGGFEVQDEGSQFLSLFALDPTSVMSSLTEAPGPSSPKTRFGGMQSASELARGAERARTVVDACAGAGGKSLALADAMGGRGRIFAYDISEGKLKALKKRAIRAGFQNIQTVTLTEGEEAAQLKKFKKKADVVLVDAPCSGWGVLRRNPDIKWRLDLEELARMPEIQQRLLGVYSEMVAPGGRLVFGVCTFRQEETTAIVERFSKGHPEFVAEAGGYLGPGPSDGFFMQSWIRK